jgi:antitoxin MazE
MKVAIVPIGNSRGVRLPKTVLDQVGFGEDAELSVAELSVEAGRIVLAPAGAARRGWAEAFAADPEQKRDGGRAWLIAPLTAQRRK